MPSENFKALNLENADVDLGALLIRGNPVGDLLDAVAKAYKIDPVLIGPYESMHVAGPLAVAPPESSQDKVEGLIRKESHGVAYYYPEMHLAGSRLYPVCFVLDGNTAPQTPEHLHPGTETIAVIKGEAEEILTKGRAQTGFTLKDGGLLQFCSEQKHTTQMQIGSLFRSWAVRELTPPPLSAPYAVLGRQLRSWRLYQKEDLPKVSERSGGLDLARLEAFEEKGDLPFVPSPSQLDKDELKALIKAYKIGAELLIPFGKPDTKGPVDACATALARKPIDDRAELSGETGRAVCYYWPDSILENSSIHPGLLRIAPFSRSPVHSHPGSEMLVVIEGKAQVRFPDNRTTIEEVRAGELAHFDSSWRHTVISTDERFLKAWVLREVRLERRPRLAGDSDVK